MNISIARKPIAIATTSIIAVAFPFMAIADTSMQQSPVSPVMPISIQCPLALPFLKIGAETNAAADVARLQHFLKSSEGADVPVNGVFDLRTEEAVKAFQKKHADVILAPWGATRASGIVYITTSKEIDRVACSKPLSLNESELAVIAAYAHKEVSVPSATPVYVDPNEQAAPPVSVTTVGPQLSVNEQNLAAVGTLSIMQKFAQFVKGLFE